MKQLPAEAKTIEDLILLTISMLIGKEGTDYSYYETDPEWWTVRLFTRRN
jgi:hypothetical protein